MAINSLINSGKPSEDLSEIKLFLESIAKQIRTMHFIRIGESSRHRFYICRFKLPKLIILTVLQRQVLFFDLILGKL